MLDYKRIRCLKELIEQSLGLAGDIPKILHLVEVKQWSAITAASLVLGLGIYAAATPKEPPAETEISVVSVYGDAVPLADGVLSDGTLQ